MARTTARMARGPCRAGEAAVPFSGKLDTAFPMSVAAQPDLEPGRAYPNSYAIGARTRHGRPNGGSGRASSAVLLVASTCPSTAAPGPPPTRLRSSVFAGDPFVVSGRQGGTRSGWGHSHAGGDACLPTKRTGEFTFRGQQDMEDPPLEGFVIDLLQRHNMASVSLAGLQRSLTDPEAWAVRPRASSPRWRSRKPERPTMLSLVVSTPLRGRHERGGA